MFKAILKKLFPRGFLKKVFLYYNKARIKTIDRVAFPEYEVDPAMFLVNTTRMPFQENNFDSSDIINPVVRKFMSDWDNWPDTEYILKFTKKSYIEPEHGWCLVERNKLLYYSLGLSRTWHQKKPAFKYILNRETTRHFPLLISARDTGEENYFHFYNDVLAKLLLLRDYGVDIYSMPVLISQKAFEKGYFRFFVKNHPVFQNIDWVQQDDEVVTADACYYCKPLTHTRKYFDVIAEPFLHIGEKRDRRILLARHPRTLRYIENMKELEPVCNRHNIEIVDTEFLPIEEQIDLFNNTTLVIGIHGAGLVNMIFRGYRKCQLLEVFPPYNKEYLPNHFALIAKQYGHDFQAILGTPGKKSVNGGFIVNPVELEEALVQLESQLMPGVGS